MIKISGKNLIDLGFKRQDVTPQQSGQRKGYHYYVFEINEETVLISCANDEKKNDGYTVEFFNIGEIGEFTDLEQIITVVKLLNSMEK